ncbi:hypothetical protein ACTM90_10010 [Oliverpabstia intestinalis]|uniref:hypothetical protein n=1 Tax=Oliverpabstia intestinalis TaxID=2606633 RepID=UPI003F89E43C
MGKIRVNTDGIEYQIQQMENVSRALETITSEIQGINRGLSWNISSREQIRRKLNEYSGYTERLCSKTKSLSSGLSTVKHQYMVTEQKAAITRKMGESVSWGEMLLRGEPIPMWITKPRPYFPWIQIRPDLIICWAMFHSLPKIPLMPKWAPMIYNAGKNTSWKLKFLDGKADASTKLAGGLQKKHTDSNWDPSKAEVGAGVEGKISGSLISGSVSGNAGIASGSGEIQVGTAAVKGEAGITLVDKGKVSPAIKVKVSGEVAAAHGEVKGQLGSDEYNAHAKLDGSLLKAEAKAEGQLGFITYDDENETIKKREFGVSGEVGAEAYVAEGKVSGGFTIAGVKINASLSGKAGGAGAKAEGRITTGGASGEINAGLGLGAGIKVDVDWSDLAKKYKIWPFA